MATFGTQLDPGSALALLVGQGAGGDEIDWNDPTTWSYLPEAVIRAYVDLTGMGYSDDEFREGLQYQAMRDDADRAARAELAEMNAQSAENIARMAAGKYTEAAAIGAEADMYAADQSLRAAQEAAAAARYAADRALEGLRISEENRMKIAAANLNLEAKRVASEELGAPSDWRKQAGFLRGMGMTQADVTPSAIQQAGQALGPVATEMYQAAPQAVGPVAPEMFQAGQALAAPAFPIPSPQQAIVGEPGPMGQPQPELLTATPQGVEVQPIQREAAWWLRKQGVQGMQGGGRVGGWDFRSGRRGVTYDIQRTGRGGITGYQAGMGGRTPTEMALPSWRRRAAESRARMEQARAIGGAAGAAGAGGGGLPVIGQPYGPGGERPVISIHQPLPTGGAGGGGTTPIAGDGTTTGEPPYLEMLRTGAHVPLWQAWGGPRTKPEVGMDIPIKMPHEINYGDFLRLTPTEQQMAFADWEALGMPPDTAFMIMQRSAMRGTGRSVTSYG